MADSAPSILSAHLGINDAAPLDGADALPVVFSHEIDPASLRAQGFLVVFADGSRVRPTDAVLSPANEGDENRTVLLIGDFGDPEKNPASDVMVVGSLYAENGVKLQGLAAQVMPFSTAGSVVLAHRLEAGEGICPGSGQAVRTYWIDGVRKVDNGDLEKIELALDDGTKVHPTAFDDHALEDEGREDNVLDLCVKETSPAQQLVIAAGAFADPPGHASAAVEAPIAALGVEE